MLKAIKGFIPPIISKRFSSKEPGYTGTKFSTYSDALKACSKDDIEKQELAEVIFAKTKRFAANLNNNVMPVWETSAYNFIAIINPLVENLGLKRINVLDFGGACGAHYFHIRALLNKAIKLNWIVVETENMIKYAGELETDELKFKKNISEAVKELGKVNLLHTSGTLQYVDDPWKYMIDLMNTNAEHILFNRLGLNEIDRDVIIVQQSKLSLNGIGGFPEGYADKWIKYPCTFISEKKFTEELKKEYSVIAKLDDKSGIIEVKGEKITGYGLLCKKKK